MNQIATQNTLDPKIIESLVLGGDVGKLTPAQKVQYVGYRCKQLGLDPAAQPFQLLRLQGKEVLYATAAATQQLCQSRGLSVAITKREVIEGIYCVEARVTDKEGRFTENMGTVPLDGLKGEVRSNAMLKCTTKAIRRTVLAHCGLGVMDETEVETIPTAQRGNPLRHEYAAYGHEIDAAKSQEQIDLILNSPEFAEFAKDCAAQEARGGINFADALRDQADARRSKLPETLTPRNPMKETLAQYVDDTKGYIAPPLAKAMKDAAQSGADVAPPSESGQGRAAEPSPVDEIMPEYSDKVQGFFDRIDLAETEADLNAIKKDLQGRASELSATDKAALNKAYTQRKRTIAAKVAA